MEIIKQSFLAAKVKEELRELKRGQQHRANLQTQASVHDSSEVIEATPMSSPISFGEDVETPPPPEVQEKKCNWCHIPFNCFETRKKRLKHIRNCKKSKGQCRGGEIACFMFYWFSWQSWTLLFLGGENQDQNEEAHLTRSQWIVLFLWFSYVCVTHEGKARIS